MKSRPRTEQLTPERERIILDELGAQARRRGDHEEPRWLPAFRIAELCNIRPGSSRDSRKRGVRELMRVLMDKHSHVISSMLPHGGYAIARDQVDLDKFQRDCQRTGLARLGVYHKSKRSIAQDDVTGQEHLVPPRPSSGPTNPMAAGM